MKNLKTEVLVIGSGFGAAPMAMRLAEAGMQVTMIEKGPAINPYKDFRQTQNPKYLLNYLKVLHGSGANFNYVEGEGGGSGFYEMMSLRAPSDIFNKRDLNGMPYWPKSVSRNLLDPFYDEAEKMLNVHQIPKNEVPKSGQVFAQMMKRLGHSTDRINYAVKGCVQCGRCVTGCIYGAKQSLLVTYLPRANKAGMLFMAETDAQYIRPVSETEPETMGVKKIDDIQFRYTVVCCNNKKEKFEISCKVLVIGAGTIGSAKLLLKSREQLPHLSPHAGQHISFNGSVKMAALIPDWCSDGDLFTGRSHPGVMSFEFLKSHGIVLTTAKPFPLQIFAAARINKFSDGEFGYLGANHVALMRQMRHRMIFLVAFGNLPPNGSLTLGEGGKLHFSMNITDVEKQFYQTGKSLITQIVEQSGGEVLDLKLMGKDGLPNDKLHFTSSHQLGSCRMSEDLNEGVVDPDGEVFGYPGMYISDGSVLPTSLTIGPSLTILANAERMANRLLKKLKLINSESDEPEFAVTSSKAEFTL